MTPGRRSFLAHAAALASAASAGAESAAPAPGLEARLVSAFERVPLYDSHEHLLPEEDRIKENADFFTIASHYALSDVISAGLGGEALRTVRDQSAPLDRRWKAFEPHWNAARFTGYGQALSLAMRDIYGAEEITGQSVSAINDAMRERNRPGLYQYVLRDRANIEWCLLDPYWQEKPAPLTPPYFLLAQKFDGFIAPASRKDLERLEGISGVSIQTLENLKSAAESTFKQAMDAGMVSVKSTLAYRRDLRFEEVAESDAARAFEAVARGGTPQPAGFRAQKERPFRKLEDHMLHHVVRLAEAHGLPFQIHTGLLANNGCFVEDTNPTLLTNLFFLYPRVRFDLFHIGYPYHQELGVLAKLFPNVYADFCWAHIISPPAARRALDEYLETMPRNKILAFGGDYRFPEPAYAHAKMARRNVARVLASKVAEGLFGEEQALETGRMLLRDNALALFPPRGMKA